MRGPESTNQDAHIQELIKAYPNRLTISRLRARMGNVPAHRYENTYCPNCRELLIKRFSFEIEKWRLTKDLCCPACGHDIAIKGQFHPGGFSYPYALI